MQSDLDDDDDMALDASGDPAFDDDLEVGGDADAPISNDSGNESPHGNKGEDIIHGDARRAIEALRESRKLKQELDDELDDFNFDESY